MGAGIGPATAARDVHAEPRRRCTSTAAPPRGSATARRTSGPRRPARTPPYPKGVSVHERPDIAGHPSADRRRLTFYYTNQQSARLMFYHDHAYGITRLNVYAGEAARLPASATRSSRSSSTAARRLPTVAPSTIPTEQIPLVIQDKTFVPTRRPARRRGPDVGQGRRWGGAPATSGSRTSTCRTRTRPTPTGANAMGRWDYGPWFWPPLHRHRARPGAEPAGRPRRRAAAIPRHARTRRSCPRPSWTRRSSTARPTRT